MSSNADARLKNVGDTFGYWLVEILRRALGWMPRALARRMAGSITWCVYSFHGKIRKAGEQRLNLALPEIDVRERRTFLRGIYRHLGWQVVEFCRMPRYTVRNTIGSVHAEGLDRFRELRARGKGVLILTSHLGAWELMSFYLSLRGYPTSMVVPRIDNRLLDYFVNGIRCLHGNRVIFEDDFARRPLTAVSPNETICIPMNTNVLLQQCVVVKTFHQDSCASSGLAHVALKTGAPVIPAFMLWEPGERQYVLHFGNELVFDRTDDSVVDIAAATQKCNDELESWIRKYPDQWLWISRRRAFSCSVEMVTRIQPGSGSVSACG